MTTFDPYDVDGDGTMDISETNAKITIELAFQKFDEDHSGYIDASELTYLIESLDVDATMTPDQIDQAMKELDADGSQRIEKDEFITWWMGMSSSNDEDSALRKRLRNLAKQGRKRLGTDIHKACWDGNLDVVQAFVSTATNSPVNQRDDNDHGDQFRPLHYAAYQGHEDVCKYLLSKGADINAQTASGCTALFFASQQGRASIVKLLLGHRASAALVERDCGLGPVDVADNGTIRGLFKSVGKYKRPERPVKVASSLSSTSSNNKTKSRSSKNTEGQVVVVVTWEHDTEGRKNRRRDGPDESLPISGFLIRAIDANTDEIVKEIDVPAGDDDGIPMAFRKHQVRVRLASGRTYVFTVAGVNGLGRSKFSEESAGFQVAGVPASPVPALTLVEISQTTATLSWDGAVVEGKSSREDEALRYVVETRRVGDSEAWLGRELNTTSSNSVKRAVQHKFQTVQETSMQNTMVQLDRLQTGSVYQVRLYLKNASGNGAPGKAIEMETPMFVAKRGGRGGSGSGRLNSSGRSTGGGGDSRVEQGEEGEEGRFAVHHR